MDNNQEIPMNLPHMQNNVTMSVDVPTGTYIGAGTGLVAGILVPMILRYGISDRPTRIFVGSMFGGTCVGLIAGITVPIGIACLFYYQLAKQLTALEENE